MLQTVPSNIPKLSSNFSIEWLVKGDTNTTKEKKFHHQPAISPTPSIETKAIDTTCSVDHNRDSSITNRISSNNNNNGLSNSMRHISSIALNTTNNNSNNNNNAHNLLHRSSYHHQQQQQQQLPQLTQTNNALSLNVMQHQQLINTQLQMAAALNYQYNASIQPQAMNFSQIFSNNFHRTSYLQRFPYGYGNGKCYIVNLI